MHLADVSHTRQNLSFLQRDVPLCYIFFVDGMCSCLHNLLSFMHQNSPHSSLICVNNVYSWLRYSSSSMQRDNANRTPTPFRGHNLHTTPFLTPSMHLQFISRSSAIQIAQQTHLRVRKTHDHSCNFFILVWLLSDNPPSAHQKPLTPQAPTPKDHPYQSSSPQ